MTCSRCPRDATAFETDATGLMQPMCEGCKTQPTLAEGTQPGRDKWVAMTEQISIETARANAAIECLRMLVAQFKREMKDGYTTSEQQSALRRAEELIG